MSVYDDFFDLEQACPDTIQDCEQLRDEYRLELKALPVDNSGRCQGCAKIQMQAKFMTKVWSAYLAKLGFIA